MAKNSKPFDGIPVIDFAKLWGASANKNGKGLDVCVVGSKNEEIVAEKGQGVMTGSASESELELLREACCDVGFFQIINPPVSTSVIKLVQEMSQKYFSLPQAEKDELKMHSLTDMRRNEEKRRRNAKMETMKCHDVNPSNYKENEKEEENDALEICSDKSDNISSSAFRGYFALMTENLDQFTMEDSYRGDAKEGFDMGIEFPSEYIDTYSPLTSWHAANRWPDETRVMGFRPAMEEYLCQMTAFGRKLVHCFARILQADEDDFLRCFSSPAVNLRLLHYPPSHSSNVSDGIKTQPRGSTLISKTEHYVTCGAHTDYGCCTLLLQDSVGGLEVLNRQKQWVKCDPIEGAFVVNIGDMLERWTNYHFRSTIHRVVKSRETASFHRYSIAFFWNPSPFVSIKPLIASHCRDGRMDVLTNGARQVYTCDQFLTSRYEKAFLSPKCP